jgi:hypothetical protein
MGWDNEHGRESSTTAKTALGLSIGALGVELLGLGGGGLLAGKLGMSENTIVTPNILSMIMAILPQMQGRCNSGRVAELEAEVANLNAKLYSNEVGINTFKESSVALEKVADRFSANFKDAFDELVNIRVANARTEEQIKCLSKETDYKIDALRAEMKLGFNNLGNAIECETKERIAAVQATRDWTECNFVKWKKVIDSTLLCPPVGTTAG